MEKVEDTDKIEQRTPEPTPEPTSKSEGITGQTGPMPLQKSEGISGKIAPSTTNSQGLFGKFRNWYTNRKTQIINKANDIINKGINTVKEKYNDVKNSINEGYKKGTEKVNQAIEWVDKHREGLAKTAGYGLKVFGQLIGIDRLKNAGDTLIEAGNDISNKSDKDKYLKYLSEKQGQFFGNKYITESNFPRIHYSRKPAAYKIYQNRNKYIDEEEAKIARLKKQIQYNQNNTAKSSKRRKKAKK